MEGEPRAASCKSSRGTRDDREENRRPTLWSRRSRSRLARGLAGLCGPRRGHSRGRAAAHYRGLRSPSRCFAEPSGLKLPRDSTCRSMKIGAQVTLASSSGDCGARMQKCIETSGPSCNHHARPAASRKGIDLERGHHLSKLRACGRYAAGREPTRIAIVAWICAIERKPACSIAILRNGGGRGTGIQHSSGLQRYPAHGLVMRRILGSSDPSLLAISLERSVCSHIRCAPVCCRSMTRSRSSLWLRDSVN